jgi:hypothetical protein
VKRLLFSLLLAAAAPCAAQIVPKKVLLIGDSHTATAFGMTLDHKLRDKFGPTVATYGVGATNIHWWVSKTRPAIPNGRYFFRAFNEGPTTQKQGYVPPPDIDALMGVDWDIVIVALGSNPDQPSLDASVTAGMLLLTKIPKNALCFWVGPPPMPVYGTHTDDFYGIVPRMLQLGGRPCTLIDSRTLVNVSQSIGSHYYGKPGADWADGAFKIISP